MDKPTFSCASCGETFTGRKRRFCPTCLPPYGEWEDKAAYQRRYMALLNPPKGARVVCSGCGGWAIGSPSCLRCRKQEARDALGPVTCQDCGAITGPPAPTHRHKRCGDCWRVVRRKVKSKRRATIRGRAHEPYLRTAIFDRDRWRCQLCGKRLKPSETYPHPDAATIDHVLPLAAGGDDVAANVQAACAHCNWHKQDLPMGEQLRLIG